MKKQPAKSLQPKSNEESSLHIVCPPLSHEKTLQYEAFTDFVIFGLSLVELCERYQKQKLLNPGGIVPTTSLSDLQKWYKDNRWDYRRGEYMLLRAKRRERELDEIDYANQVNLARLNQQLLTTIGLMAQHPIVHTRNEEEVEITQDMVGKKITKVQVVVPADWSLATIGNLLNAFSNAEEKRVTRTERVIALLRSQGYEITRGQEVAVTAGEAFDRRNQVRNIGAS